MTLTDIQEEIIDAVEEDESLTNKEVSDKVGCSESYASQIRRKYRHLTNELLEIDSQKVWPIFSKPFEVYTSPEFQSEAKISDANPIEVVVDSNSEGTESFVTCQKDIDELDFEDEIKGLVYATHGSFESIYGEIKARLDNYDVEGENAPDIYDSDSLSAYISDIEGILKEKLLECDVFIGVRVLEVLSIHLKDDSEFESSLLRSNPMFLGNQEFVSDCLAQEFPPLQDVRMYSGEVDDDIDEAMLVHLSEMSDNSREKLMHQIDSRGYFDLEYEDIFPQGSVTYGMFVESESKVAKFSSDDIRLVEHLTRRVSYSGTLSNEEIVDTLHGMPIYVGEDPPEEDGGNIDDSKTGLQAEKFRGGVTISLATFSIALLIDEDELTWSYPEIFEELIEALESYLQTKLEISILSNRNVSDYQKLDADGWIFDTNSIYHEIDDGSASSILRTIFAENNIAGSEVHVPWIVLYEINKHKDKGGPNSHIQQKGIDNLDTLEILADRGFIDLHTQPFPQKEVGRVSESDIADLYISNYAQHEDLALVTGDKRLRELSEFAGISTVNIYNYADVESIPDLEDEIKDSILSRIGDDLIEKEDILSELKDELDKTKKDNLSRYRSEDPAEAGSYLDQWEDNQSIIPYISDEEIAYSPAQPYDVVPTISAVVEICSGIVKHDDGHKYLSETVLDTLKSILNTPGNEYPFVHFHFPIASVLSHQSTTIGGLSREGQDLYKIEQLYNAEYTTEELENSRQDNHIHDAVLLAKQLDCKLLCAEEDEYLKRIGRLLGVSIAVLNE